MICPEHGESCIWYQHSSADHVGLDLGVGDGISNGVDFARAHQPMASHLYPISDGRGDYFALGFLRGVIQAWCPDHEDFDCLGTHRCWLKVRAIISGEPSTAATGAGRKR